MGVVVGEAEALPPVRGGYGGGARPSRIRILRQTSADSGIEDFAGFELRRARSSRRTGTGGSQRSRAHHVLPGRASHREAVWSGDSSGRASGGGPLLPLRSFQSGPRRDSVVFHQRRPEIQRTRSGVGRSSGAGLRKEALSSAE